MKKMHLLALAAVAGTTAAAYAQPASFTDLGDYSTAATTTSTPITLSSGAEIKWFKVIFGSTTNIAGNWVDIWTEPAGAAAAATDIGDSEIGLYRSTGAFVTYDDDDGAGTYSCLTYGSTASRGAVTFAGLSNGRTRNGGDGSLTAGTYYIAVGHYDMTFGATAFGVTTNSTSATEVNCKLVLNVSPNLVPTPPTVTAGAASPANSPSGIATTRVLTANVGLGTNPSSPIASVTADLSALGGPAAAAFHDDGANGDVTAADGVYSYSLAGVTGPVGVNTVTVTATDGQSRSASGTINVGVFAYTNLGDLSSGAHSVDLTINNTNAADLTWYRVVLPAVNAVGAGFVDIWTAPTADPTPATDMTDTEIGLFSASGAGAGTNYNDDDSGPGNWSLLTYGSTTSRGAVTTSAGTGDLRDGFNGTLAGGEYYLVVGRYNVEFAQGFGATGLYTGTERNTVVHIETLDNTAPTNPVLSAAAATPATGTSGTPVTINVTVAPGTNPASSGLAVTADLTSLGGGSSVAMSDPENDGIYSVSTTIPAGAGDFSSYSVTIDAVDAQNRHATQASVTLHGQATALDEATLAAGEAGDSLATAGVFSGTGALNAISGTFGSTTDVDMYKITVCDAANFVASTEFSNPTSDTQIFLFNDAGMGVSHNDDYVTIASVSRIDNTGVSNGNTYYIAVNRYNVDPVDSAAALLWNNAGPGGEFTGVRTPDGPGAANALSAWTGTGATGSYRLSFQGACLPAPAQCSLADIGGQGGVPAHDNHLDNNDFVVFIDYFFNHNVAADLGSQGGVHAADGQWDNNDFVVFIDYFFNDAANCQG